MANPWLFGVLAALCALRSRTGLSSQTHTYACRGDRREAQALCCGRTCPKATLFPSRLGCALIVMMNCEPLVFGPTLAMLRTPGAEWLRPTQPPPARSRLRATVDRFTSDFNLTMVTSATPEWTLGVLYVCSRVVGTPRSERALATRRASVVRTSSQSSRQQSRVPQTRSGHRAARLAADWESQSILDPPPSTPAGPAL